MAQHVYNWKHGWIPITPTAVRQKNHGRMPKHGSKASAAADRFIRTGSSKSSTDHVKAATEAVKAGDHATAINHLTAAIGKSSGAEREAIKAHRDRLARKVMHGNARQAEVKKTEDALPSKAPRELAPGDVVHYHGVPMTVLSHPREGAVRGYKAVWGRRHDTGKEGRVDFLSNDPMKVHGSEKVSASDAKAHTATLKGTVDAKRARLRSMSR